MNHIHDQEFCINCFINEIDPLLPVQGPIKDFIAGTRVPLFIPFPYEEGLKRAASLYNCRSFMELEYYREQFAQKEISPQALKQAIKEEMGEIDKPSLQVIEYALHHYKEIFDEKTFYFLLKQKKIPLDKAQSILQSISYDDHKSNPSIRYVVHKKLHEPMDHAVHALLFRLLGSYLDQGVNLWPFLDRYSGFKNAVLIVASKSEVPLAPFIINQDLVELLQQDSLLVIKNLLGKILGSKDLYRPYLMESLLAHPGWSGMVHMISKNPDALAKKRPITLLELIVVKLAFEWQFIKNRCSKFSLLQPDELNKPNGFKSDAEKSYVQSLTYFLLNLPKEFSGCSSSPIKRISLWNLQKIWHEALEKSYNLQIADALLVSPKNNNAIKQQKDYQAVFCIDDRECSLRRLLEQQSPQIETFGYAGFFGIDCYFKAHKKDVLDKICPLPVTPHHIIIEKPPGKKNNNKQLIEFASFITLHGANSTLFGFISAYTIGHLSLFRLVLSFLHPFKLFQSKRSAKIEKTTLLFQRKNKDESYQGLHLGYTEEEMAQRVFSVLNNMGLIDHLSPLIFMIGHGSSSVNNPHFAAYDCGACSGRPGSVNARVFAAMANLLNVRKLVKDLGIEIPESTHFIGGYHDTCTDSVTFFDTDMIPITHQEQFKKFTNYMDKASGLNAVERCRKFALVPKNVTPIEAIGEVSHRSKALFEPRPELGHATNALCIVGRRSRSYKMNFERRAFLQSYDPSLDPDGTILGNILTAVIPVCGGINLEYTLSRIDPAIHGCGTKLSHNVCSLIGVGNGLDDDLRTGLPIQNTELHIPIRLLIVIEQKPELIVNVIKANANLKPWLTNGWVKIASLPPHNNTMSVFNYRLDQFEECSFEERLC